MGLMIIIGALELGGIFSIMSLGLYMSYKVLNIPDLTVDGSFVLGCAISALCTINGYPYLGIICSFLFGLCAGYFTSVLITRLNIMPLLAGILTMTGLYSINLRIMQERPNISLFECDTIFNSLCEREYISLFIIYILVFLLILVIYYFLKTQLGLALRACGDNEDMVKASSIDTDKMKMLGLSLANGLVAMSGGIFAQYQMFADIQSGTGMMVIALASIIVGLSIIKKDTLLYQLLAVVFGSIFYRIILTFALQLGLPSGDLKLLSALLVIISIFISNKAKRGNKYVRVK